MDFELNRGATLYSWPNHFPLQCPPPEATELSGQIFRFINGPAPVDWDFLSHYERRPAGEWGDACKARGISVVRTYEDCQIMRAGVPALRKKRLAVASIESSVGLISNSPSGTCQGHCTWWRSSPAGEVKLLFANFAEVKGPRHE